MQLNEQLLEDVYEYYIFEKSFKKWKQEQEFINFCNEILDREIQKEMELV